MSLALPVLLLAAVSMVHGHAVVTEPPPRKTGPAHEAACGLAVVDVLESGETLAIHPETMSDFDRYRGPYRERSRKADEDYNCNAFLCRGYQFEDNTDNVLTVQVGEVLYFHVDLIAGHHPGYANVSVVNTATNEAIGDPLRTWDNWPDHLSGPPRDDIDYNVTIPDSLGSTCSEAGNCVIQWYWYASGNEQTYESCHDFYVEA